MCMCCVYEDVARDSYDEDEDEGEEEEEEEMAAAEPIKDRNMLIEKYRVRPWLCVQIKIKCLKLIVQC